MKISHTLQAVVADVSRCILHHDRPPLVIGIDQCKCCIRQLIKKLFFGRDVGRKGSVIVEVIMGHIGENPTFEIQPCDSSLIHSMRTHLHKGMRAACLYHTRQQFLQTDCIRGCVQRRFYQRSYPVFNCRNQPASIAQPAKCLK